MNKKGFTLVELLAVIAIVAVLVIVALPNVIEMFNGAKESTFTTELKKIYRGAEEEYISDAFSSSGTVVYSKCSGCAKPLKMDIRDDLEYYIEINSSGKVTKFYAKDKNFQFAHSGDLLLTEIQGVQKIADLESDDIITITASGVTGNNSVQYVYFNSPGRYFKFTNELPTDVDTASNYQDLVNSNSLHIFLRVASDNYSDVSIGFVGNGNVYYLPKNATETEIENTLKSYYGNRYDELCSKDNGEYLGQEDHHIYCSNSDGISVGVEIANNGQILMIGASDNIINSSYECTISSSGNSCSYPK